MSPAAQSAPVARQQREWPLLCADSVVRNILSGAQTQDRRPIIHPRNSGGGPVPSSADVFLGRDGAIRYGAARLIRYAPRVGDLLWVRECWGHDDSANHTSSACWFRADSCTRCATGVAVCEHGPTRWRPSIHMPRWACRLVLPITRVWVERIQKISEKDARAEGHRSDGTSTARGRFVVSWESFYPGSYNRNDWVLCVEWERPAAVVEVRR